MSEPGLADFFQPGHVYSDATGWRFECAAITDHPDSRERVAIGWLYVDHRWEEQSYGEPQWAALQANGVDVTRAGEAS